MIEHNMKRVGELVHELPKIDTAIKNYLSVRLANLKVEGGNPGRGEFRLSSNGEWEKQPDKLEAKALQRIAGSILRNVNDLTLLEPVKWSAKYPQRENQTGLHRMDEIGDYKVQYMVWKRIRSAESKITKSLGKSFLVLVWEEIKAKCLKECAEEKSIGTKEQVLEFLDTLESSWGANKELQELVWSKDLSSVLKKHAEARQKRRSEHEDVASSIKAVEEEGDPGPA